MKSKFAFLFLTIIGLIIFISILLSIGLSNIFYSLSQMNFIFLIPYFFFSFCIILTHSLRWKVILSSQGNEISLLRLFLYYVSGFSSGYLSPFPLSGGEGIKVILIKKHTKSYHKALTSIILDKSIEKTINLLLAFIGIILVIITVGLPVNLMLIFFFGFLLMALILSYYYYCIIKSKGFFSKILLLIRPIHASFVEKHYLKIKESEDVMATFFIHHKKSFKLSILLSFISWVFMFAEYKFLMLAVGHNVNFFVLVMVITVVGIAYAMPIPAALGVLEGGQASLFKFLSLDIMGGVLVSLLTRLRDLLMSLIGLLYLFNYGIKFKEK